MDPCAGQRRVAVVGAEGFIGKRLIAALRGEGFVVAGYTRRAEPCWPDEATGPDIVFYLASSVTPALAEAHPEWVTTDHRYFAELLCRLAQCARPPTVVLTSSAGTVYDPDVAGACPEDAPTRATSRYGAAKLALERLLLDHAGTFPAVILRLSNVYGPNQRVDKSQGVLAYWLSSALGGRPLPVIGDTGTRRDYVYVDDVVECMLRVAAWSSARTAGSPAIFNVATGVRTSLAELFSIVESVVGRELPVERLPGRPVDRADTHLDVRAAARLLGWRSRTGLMEGVTAMWRSLRPEPETASSPAGAPVGTLGR